MFRQGYDSQQHTVLVKGIVRGTAVPAAEDDTATPVVIPRELLKQSANYSCTREIHGRSCTITLYAGNIRKKPVVYIQVEDDDTRRKWRRQVSTQDILVCMEEIDPGVVCEALGTSEQLFQHVSRWVLVEQNQIVLKSSE